MPAEIHTLDEFAVFHWEFIRLENRLTKEKRFSVKMVLTGHMKKKHSFLSSGTKSCSILLTNKTTCVKGELSWSNMSGKGQTYTRRFFDTIQDIPTLDDS